MEQLLRLPFSSIAAALEYQAKMRAEKIAILYPDRNRDCREYESLTYRQYNNLVNSLARKIINYLPLNSAGEAITCAILAAGGIEYLLCEYALLKIPNVIMFPISGRNSQSAVEHLLKETKTRLLLTTSEYLPMIKLIEKQEEFQWLKVLFLDEDLFIKEELFKKNDLHEYLPESFLNVERRTKEEELNRVVVILHR